MSFGFERQWPWATWLGHQGNVEVNARIAVSEQSINIFWCYLLLVVPREIFFIIMAAFANFWRIHNWTFFIAYLTQLNLTYVILLELCSQSPKKGTQPPSTPLLLKRPQCCQTLRMQVTKFWWKNCWLPLKVSWAHFLVLANCTRQASRDCLKSSATHIIWT